MEYGPPLRSILTILRSGQNLRLTPGTLRLVFSRRHATFTV